MYAQTAEPNPFRINALSGERSVRREYPTLISPEQPGVILLSRIVGANVVQTMPTSTTGVAGGGGKYYRLSGNRQITQR